MSFAIILNEGLWANYSLSSSIFLKPDFDAIAPGKKKKLLTSSFRFSNRTERNASIPTLELIYRFLLLLELLAAVAAAIFFVIILPAIIAEQAGSVAVSYSRINSSIKGMPDSFYFDVGLINSVGVIRYF